MSQGVAPKDISKAKNPDMRSAWQAMHRAAELARQTAIQTNTAIIVVKDGVQMRITAEQLLNEQAKNPNSK